MTDADKIGKGEAHYRKLIDILRESGVERLGLMTGGRGRTIRGTFSSRCHVTNSSPKCWPG